MTDSPTRISASQVTLILQRAAELDARGDTLTVGELRRIASEAGIDPAATEAAIEEIMGAEESEEPPTLPEKQAEARLPVPRTRSPSGLWIAVSGAVGATMGFLTALPEAIGASAFGGMLVYLILRVLQSMKRGTQLDFQLQNFAVWLGTFVGVVGAGGDDEEAFAVAVLLWILTSVVGGLLVRFGPREEEPEGDVLRIGPGHGQGR